MRPTAPRRSSAYLSWFAATALALVGTARADLLPVPAPAGSGEFGAAVIVLPNGNFVVADPLYDFGTIADAGAVYLYSPDGVLLSRLVGTHDSDRVGSACVQALANGNVVVSSPLWDGARGAVTLLFADDSRANVQVSEANSLVGAVSGDRIGELCVKPLNNGNYVVLSPLFRNASGARVGAATWRSGSTILPGTVSAANSLVGSFDRDFDASAVSALANGNYVVATPSADIGVTDAGAVTWGSGVTGVSGVIGPTRSLVGSQSNDQVGVFSTLRLANGNYVVLSPYWSRGAVTRVGAATFGDGRVGIVGAVTPGNSLVGRSEGDQLAVSTDLVLPNGGYVLASEAWDSDTVADAGAVTWCGPAGCSGEVDEAQTLYGETSGDLDSVELIALANGHFAVGAPYYDTAFGQNAGVVVRGDGLFGSNGPLGASAVLAGARPLDYVGSNLLPLRSGNFVVGSPDWSDSGDLLLGAATALPGSITPPGFGAVTRANSLVGTSAGDRVGRIVVPLIGDAYLVAAPDWDNPATGLQDVGAALRCASIAACRGSGGIGTLTAANALTGSLATDRIGDIASALSDGNAVVGGPSASSPSTSNVGAVAWLGAGTPPGVVSIFNAIAGASIDDRVGSGGIKALPNGDYIIFSPLLDNGPLVNAGAVTLGAAGGSTTGSIGQGNSVRGNHIGTGPRLVADADPLRRQLVVGSPVDNQVTLLRPGETTTSTLSPANPDRIPEGTSATLTAIVRGQITAPLATVRISSDRGESCTATLTAPTDPGEEFATYRCNIRFGAPGLRLLRAEFFGTLTHGYSLSQPAGIDVRSDTLLSDGFE